MNGAALAGVLGCITWLALASPLMYFSWVAWRWPRCLGTVVGHEPFLHWKNDGWLIIAFADKNGNKFEAKVSDDGRTDTFLQSWPIGSTIELCYNPRKPVQVVRPRGPVAFLFILVITVIFLTQMLRWFIFPVL